MIYKNIIIATFNGEYETIEPFIEGEAFFPPEIDNIVKVMFKGRRKYIFLNPYIEPDIVTKYLLKKKNSYEHIWHLNNYDSHIGFGVKEEFRQRFTDLFSNMVKSLTASKFEEI